MKSMRPNFALLILVFSLFLAACSEGSAGEPQIFSPSGPGESLSQTPSASTAEQGESAPLANPTNPAPTAPPPTPTPQLAALVNGQPILLADYEKELARYELAQAELGIEAGAGEENYQSIVLDALIERELIRQAAVVYGISITPEMVDSNIEELRVSASEYGSFDTWLETNQWTLDEFRVALATEMMVEAVVEQVTADVPYAVEQVRANYIQVDNAAEAELIISRLQEGGDFSALAEQYSLDQSTAPYGGDLGFFAQGSLLVPAVEEAAFAMQIGEVSDVISVSDPDSGQTIYYIIKVTDREASRPLSANLRYKLLQEAYDAWLADLQASATVIRYDQ